MDMVDSKLPNDRHVDPSENSEEDLVCLGVIQGPHGIKGELKLRSFTQDPRQIGAYGPLILKGCEETLTILKLRSQKDTVFVVRFKEVQDRETAELLNKQEVFVKKENLPEISEPEAFYFADLVGLTVHSTQKRDLGMVEAVFDFGAGDILELKVPQLKETIMIPFLKEWIVELDLEAGFVVVDAVYLAEYLKPFKQSDERWDESKNDSKGDLKVDLSRDGKGTKK